jgi:ribulose-5-phosphate 4-epimerase/fuculose-1-phosphate aldolase
MKLSQKYAEQVEQFLLVCGRLAQNMFVTSAGGNLAWKLEDDLILITPTKMNKGILKVEDLVFVRRSGLVVEGVRRPTGELPMYVQFFNQREDVISVIHCHPPAVCAFAILKGKNWLMRPLFPEMTVEVGPVPVVPYAEPLTEQLALNFAPFLTHYDSFIMENHGLVTMSRTDILSTLYLVEMAEMTARSILMALPAGELKELDREAVRGLENTMKTRGLPLYGAPGVNESLVTLYFDTLGV